MAGPTPPPPEDRQPPSLADRLTLLPVRIGIVVVVALWCLAEWFLWHDPFFRWLTLAALVYAIWSQLIGYKPPSGGTNGSGGR